MNINLEISNITPNCKSSLSVSSNKTSTYQITNIVELFDGYGTKTKKIKIALNDTLLLNSKYPFNIPFEYEFQNEDLIEYFWVEKCEEVSGVTHITIFGEIKKLITLFGKIEVKELTDEITFTYSPNLQKSEELECQIGSFAISGLTQNSVRIITNETIGKFKYLRIRLKEYGTDNWFYYETTDKNFEISNLKPQTFYYISYMKYCDFNKFSFYSESIEFKTF
jgi:hypothetical protein